jgi:hypothetical protein
MDLQFRSRVLQPLQHRHHGPARQHPHGSGFGEISKTAGNSRQIQLSLKLIY